MLMTPGWCKWHCFAHITVICNLQIIYCHLPSPVVEHCNPNCPTATWSPLFPMASPSTPVSAVSAFPVHGALQILPQAEVQ